MIRKLAFFQELISAVAVQEQLLRELDMYQEIAVARTGLEYDTLNVKMDHCQESIETLSDEIQRLQGELSHIRLLIVKWVSEITLFCVCS